MAEMFSLWWRADGEAWVWRRQLKAWEEMLGECQTLLFNLSLQAQSSDRWKWQSDPDKGYTIRGAYQLLTSQVSTTIDETEDLIWHTQVPLKVSIFTWRLLRDSLPTKANLVTRGILSQEAHFCTSGCGAVESAQHLFISCGTFGSLWALVRSWIDFSSVDPIFFVIISFSLLTQNAPFFYATHMAYLCVGVVDRKKSQIVQRLSKHRASNDGQDQAFFFKVVEDVECYFSFKLS
ncbi:70 kDa peptidyl-prolyl isomerase [Trifolium medium]|uniref:70 kDa peptidyl-prolyl isomerase n=1 Tax=Trifolium medium TaxID=97028 RepID=A0A392NLI1_9FABA|nr:70 kDa peptidyl-prolyl isomerase [Trifolium medium]